MPKAVPSTTLAVLRATPGSVSSSSMVRGTLPCELLDDLLAGALNRFCLVAEKAGGANFGFQLSRIRIGEIFGRRIFLEQRARNLVDAHVGALRGKDRGDQQLEGVVVFEGAGDVRDRPRRVSPEWRDALGSRRQQRARRSRRRSPVCAPRLLSLALGAFGLAFAVFIAFAVFVMDGRRLRRE